MAATREEFQGMATIFNLAVSPSATVATAYYANSAFLLSNMATTLGKHDDARYYSDLSSKVAAAWRAKFVRHEGCHIGDDKQDDYVRALAFELLLPSQRDGDIARLVQLIEQAGFHLQTGFLGTPMLLPVLSSHGKVDVAFRLLLQDTSPSWLYQVNRGATTIWETWEGYIENGDAKESHNHYAFGAVASWHREGIAGLSPAEPGYRKIMVAPTIGGGLIYARGTVETPFRPAKSGWLLDSDETVTLDVLVPAGATAVVHYRGKIADGLKAGSHQFCWMENPTSKL